jgi:hypothetical protein
MPSANRVAEPETLNSEPLSQGSGLDGFIHRENLALFRKRLAETHDAATHEVLLQLLAAEEAKGKPPPG